MLLYTNRLFFRMFFFSYLMLLVVKTHNIIVNTVYFLQEPNQQQ